MSDTASHDNPPPIAKTAIVSPKSTAATTVDLDAAAHDDRLEGGTFRSCCDDRGCCLTGEPFGQGGSGACIGLPDRQVNQHVRVERGDDIDDALAVAGIDEVELAAAQAAPWRVDVDAENRAHPGLGFEQQRDERTEFSAHSADEHPLPAHNRHVIGVQGPSSEFCNVPIPRVAKGVADATGIRQQRGGGAHGVDP